MILDGIASRVLGTKDYARLPLWMTKMFLRMIFLWPGAQNTFCFVIFFSCCLMMILGVVSYFIRNLDDYENTMSTFAMVLSNTESSYKLAMLWLYSKPLKKVLDDIFQRFWPYDLIEDHQLQTSMKNVYSGVLILSILLSMSGGGYVMVFLGTAAWSQRKLPYPVHYVFDWSLSPAYELLYCFQCFSFGYIMLNAVLGVDVLVLSVCACVVQQYKILQYLLLNFNTPRMVEINEMFEKMGEEANPSYDDEKKYLVRCIELHQLVLRVTRNINKALSSIQLFQLSGSATSIGVGLFQLTKGSSTFFQYAMAFTYIFAHLTQLLIFCSVGNELYYQASLLPQSIFLSNWSESSVELKKDILIVLQKSQQVPELAAYNLFAMNYDLFVRVLKVAFSSFTLLSKMAKKQS